MNKSLNLHTHFHPFSLVPTRPSTTRTSTVLFLLLFFMRIALVAAVDNYTNLCRGATITASDMSSPEIDL